MRAERNCSTPDVATARSAGGDPRVELGAVGTDEREVVEVDACLVEGLWTTSGSWRRSIARPSGVIRTRIGAGPSGSATLAEPNSCSYQGSRSW